jgi:SAM-dependent methyltransferase
MCGARRCEVPFCRRLELAATGRSPPGPGRGRRDRAIPSSFVEKGHRESVERIRSRIRRELPDPSEFRAALLSVPPSERDAWLDLVLGFDDVPDDGPDLPRGCVPYFPCSVDALLRTVEQARVRPSDVVVDVGSGPGRAAAFVHLLTGAAVIGIEIQSGLVRAARDLATRMVMPRVACVEGDAVRIIGLLTTGSVFFLYCPFSGDRLVKVLAALEPVARTRMIRVCALDLPLPPCPWLTLEPQPSGDLAIYRSALAYEAFGRE